MAAPVRAARAANSFQSRTMPSPPPNRNLTRILRRGHHNNATGGCPAAPPVIQPLESRWSVTIGRGTAPPLQRRLDGAARRHHHDAAVVALDRLDLAQARQARSRPDLEQRAAAALDHGAAGVEVAEPPAFERRRLGILLR